ncbi:MAG: small multi-drug export protein [archaeon]
MDLKLVYALILTVMPITELRVGMPVAIVYAVENNVPLYLMFGLIVLLNILLILFIFFFLDNLHKFFMKISLYKKFFEFCFKRIRRKIENFNKNYKTIGFFALVLFVAIPLPGTGAWTGCLVSWVLGLERKKSILSIALGVLIAGTIIFLASLGFMEIF